ncbi:MAG: type II toxin-antitoxin system RelE/ParE family toxin [Rhizonema sp. PD37]|nr:type II toxin-antitoxin system RelE/ParE family toxin [Rhizonema sp. PD37]
MRITYLSQAVLDLVEIRAYIAADNAESAQRIGSKLRESIHKLEQFSNLGKPGRVFGTRELNTSKIGKTTYILVYRLKQDEIQLLRVLSGMRDIDAILEKGFPEEEN